MRKREVEIFRPCLRMGLVGMLIGSVAVLISGDLQAKVMRDVQPMKMAAAEALYNTSQPASFSLVTVGTLDGAHGGLVDPHPGRAVVHGNRQLRRQGRGHQRRAGAVHAALRTR